MPIGGNSMVVGTGYRTESGGKSGNFTGANPIGMGTGEATPRRDRAADRGKEDPRGVVQGMEIGESGWEHVGCGGHARESGTLWEARSKPRSQRLSASPICIASGEWNPRFIRYPNGCLLYRRNNADY